MKSQRFKILYVKEIIPAIPECIKNKIIPSNEAGGFDGPFIGMDNIIYRIKLKILGISQMMMLIRIVNERNSKENQIERPWWDKIKLKPADVFKVLKESPDILDKSLSILNNTEFGRLP